jgi:hypothetical protein
MHLILTVGLYSCGPVAGSLLFMHTGPNFLALLSSSNMYVHLCPALMLPALSLVSLSLLFPSPVPARLPFVSLYPSLSYLLYLSFYLLCRCLPASIGLLDTTHVALSVFPCFYTPTATITVVTSFSQFLHPFSLRLASVPSCCLLLVFLPLLFAVSLAPLLLSLDIHSCNCLPRL